MFSHEFLCLSHLNTLKPDTRELIRLRRNTWLFRFARDQLAACCWLWQKRVMGSNTGKDLKPWMEATYRIKVQGYLDESRSEFLGGMTITTASQGDQGVVTTLEGRLKDQAEFSGVLNTLYELHLPVLLVECIRNE